VIEQRQQLQQRLEQVKADTGFAAIGFADWVAVLSDWLAVWQWRTNTGGELNSLQYQLQQRWLSLLQEFASLATVQRRAGLVRATDVLQQLVRNTIFLPKAAASPIVISGVLEATGRQVDTCFLTGMHQDYPGSIYRDAFVSASLLAPVGHPEASAQSSFEQSKAIVDNLLNCARHRTISYAEQSDLDSDLQQMSSPLFMDRVFTTGNIEAYDQLVTQAGTESFSDTRGPAWSGPGPTRGGSLIFEDQSNCAFKAFATHQLGFTRVDEAEFGLDGIDRGNVLHQLMNGLWRDLQSQSMLLAMDQQARLRAVNNVIENLIDTNQADLNSDKITLLRHEKPRLQRLLLDWLETEASRPAPFAVVEREEEYRGEIGGITFRYVLDRVDLLDDGRSVIIDYKTGLVNRNDWLGERLRSPQMPLYALARDHAKSHSVSGIAFAQVRQGDSAYKELAESGIFRKAGKREQNREEEWHQRRADWPSVFDALASDFLAGEATVNPIDDKVCQRCELQAFCRIAELRGHQ
jgi:probable DNA repair protein